jgi:hypothetical protein
VAEYVLDFIAPEAVRAQERRRFQDQLHNSVKTQISALLKRAEEVQEGLSNDPKAAAASLQQLRRIAVAIRSNGMLLSSELGSTGSPGERLLNSIHEELLRLAGPQGFGGKGSSVQLQSRGLSGEMLDLPSRSQRGRGQHSRQSRRLSVSRSGTRCSTLVRSGYACVCQARGAARGFSS